MRLGVIQLVLIFGLGTVAQAVADAVPFSVPDGFTVTEVAVDELVHDAFCMTLDPAGRPVISGPGYIRTLVDQNKDGIFDRAVTWVQLPKQGAQGLWAEGNEIYWVGDGGLWVAADRNSDLVADGPPRKVLTLPTGGEHDSHAIRRGPDGYWYLTVGNFANGIAGLQNDAEAPIARPRAGTVWRISPDFKTRSVWAHGLRNAYDFDFLPSGQVVTFDSDSERDVSLPWYRPMKVLALSAGSDAGWVSNAWIDPASRVTMPRVVAELGRGSPTGVVVYQHSAFPQKYRHAIFVLDWTFGRVMVVYPESTKTGDATQSGTNVRIGAETFMQPTGSIGFAPTDICVEPSGSLLVCVGGRGTRGAIYRIGYTGDSPAQQPSLFVSSISKSAISGTQASKGTSGMRTMTGPQAKELAQVLLAPCPWEAWSEARWRPIAEKLGPAVIATAAVGGFVDESGAPLTIEARCVALMQLVRMGLPISPVLVDGLLESKDPSVLAAAWWMMARANIVNTPDDIKRWQKIAEERMGVVDSPMSSFSWGTVFGGEAQRAMFECFGLKHWSIIGLPVVALDDAKSQRSYRQAVLWASSRDRSPKRDASDMDAIAGSLLFGHTQDRINAAALDVIARNISAKRLGDNPTALMETLTIIQAALGDPRHTMPQQQEPPNPNILDGYSAFFASQIPENVRGGWVKWLMSTAEAAGKRKDLELQAEALRTLAMIEPDGLDVATYCLSLINEQSHPTNDIHMLCVVARCKATRTSAITADTVRAVLAIQPKVKSHGLNTDNHWQPRLLQLLEGLLKRDAQLASTIVQSPEFGKADDMLWISGLPNAMQQQARTKVQARLESLPPKQWSVPLVRFACELGIPKTLLTAIREAASEPSMRATAVELLATDPQAADYEVFLSSLASNDRSAWSAAWKGLNQMTLTDAKSELKSLPVLLARISTTASDLPKIAVAARIRSAAWNLKLTNVPSNAEWKEWQPFLKANVEPATWQQIESFLSPSSKWTSEVESSAKVTGDAARGQAIYVQAKCAQCHGNQNALGPDLAGVTRRFSRDDLFLAVFEPNRDISDRYRAVQVLTTNGQVLIGMRVYESVDGVTLQAADGRIIRVNQDDIEHKSTATQSLMPSGLLDGMKAEQLADLYAYIRSL